MKKAVSRRKFLAGAIAGATLADVGAAQDAPESRQASGVKVGEVTDTSALVLMRLSASAGPNVKGREFPPGKPIPLPMDVRVQDLRGACPGAEGRVRLRYSTNADLSSARTTDWVDVAAKIDFSRQF